MHTHMHAHTHARTHTPAERSTYINKLISKENILKTAIVRYLDDLAKLKFIIIIIIKTKTIT